MGKSELWFYANITLANQTQASPCPDIVHLFVDSTVNPPVLKEQTISDANPTTDAPPNCKYGSASAPYTGTYSTRLVGKYIVNGTSSCITPDPVFVYWYDDGSGTPVEYPTPVASLLPTETLQVNAVGITFAVRQSTNFKVPCATLVNRVRLANVDYNPIPSPVP